MFPEDLSATLNKVLADGDVEHVAVRGIPLSDNGQVLDDRLELAGRHRQILLDRLASLIAAVERLDAGVFLKFLAVYDLDRRRLSRKFSECFYPGNSLLVESLLRWRFSVICNLADTDHESAAIGIDDDLRSAGFHKEWTFLEHGVKRWINRDIGERVGGIRMGVEFRNREHDKDRDRAREIVHFTDLGSVASGEVNAGSIASAARPAASSMRA